MYRVPEGQMVSANFFYVFFVCVFFSSLLGLGLRPSFCWPCSSERGRRGHWASEATKGVPQKQLARPQGANMNTINKHRATPKALGQKIVYSIVFVCENYSGPFTINKILGAFCPPRGGLMDPPRPQMLKPPRSPTLEASQQCFAPSSLASQG